MNFVSNNFFLNHAIYEIMWKNIVESDRPQMKLWRMRIAYWIPKATNTHTHTLCNIYCFSTATIVAQTRLNLPYTYIACLVKISYQNRSSALQVFAIRYLRSTIKAPNIFTSCNYESTSCSRCWWMTSVHYTIRSASGRRYLFCCSVDAGRRGAEIL